VIFRAGAMAGEGEGISGVFRSGQNIRIWS